MARFVAGAALLGLCRADAWGAQPGQFGYDDRVNKVYEFMFPQKVPGHDKCSIDCTALCEKGLGRSWRNAMSNSDCVNSCYAHSIETPHHSTGFFDKSRQQGKYVQKVMAEYCGRGLCGAGLLQAEVHKHEQKEGSKYSPNAWKGDPRAMPSGWPEGCEKQDYYCEELCQNLYHKPTSDLGEHFGATEASWSRDQAACKRDCSSNFQGLKVFFDDWCSCFQKEDGSGDMKLENVPGLLQESPQPAVSEADAAKIPDDSMLGHDEPTDEAEMAAAGANEVTAKEAAEVPDSMLGHDQPAEAPEEEAESVDVGSFMQLSVEL